MKPLSHHARRLGASVRGKWKGRPMDFMKVLFVAVCVLGTVQFLKTFKFDAGWPTWAWAVLDLPLLIGYGALFFYAMTWIQYAALALPIMQLGYENLLQPIKKFIGVE